MLPQCLPPLWFRSLRLRLTVRDDSAVLANCAPIRRVISSHPPRLPPPRRPHPHPQLTSGAIATASVAWYLYPPRSIFLLPPTRYSRWRRLRLLPHPSVRLTKPTTVSVLTQIPEINRLRPPRHDRSHLRTRDLLRRLVLDRRLWRWTTVPL